MKQLLSSIFLRPIFDVPDLGVLEPLYNRSAASATRTTTDRVVVARHARGRKGKKKKKLVGTRSFSRFSPEMNHRPSSCEMNTGVPRTHNTLGEAKIQGNEYLWQFLIFSSSYLGLAWSGLVWSGGMQRKLFAFA